MADLTTARSSSVVEHPEAGETKENIPPAKRHLLDERDFPDISLIDTTENDDAHHGTMEESSLLKNLPATPLIARTSFRNPATMVEIVNDNPKLASLQTPGMEGKANGSQARKAETNASVLWVQNESLPYFPDYSFESFMEQRINFTVNISPSDMQSLCNGAPEASVESNLARAATLDDSREPSPLAGGTRLLSDSGSADRHHETFDAKLPSASGGTVKPPESNLSGGDTFDVQPPSHCSGGESSSRDTFDGHPPSQSTSTLTMSEKGRSSGSGCRHALDATPPSQSNGTFTMLESSSSHGLQNTFDAQLPKSRGTFTVSQSDSSDGQRQPLDARPGKPGASASQLGDGLQSTFDAPRSSSDCRPNASAVTRPASNGTIDMSQSLSGEARHATFDAKPPSGPDGANVLSGSCSRDCQPNTLDPNPASGPGSADGNADAGEVESPQGEASASRAGRREAKHHPTLPTHDQSLDPDNSRGFNLDDTLNLKHGNFATSTPLTNCKMSFCAWPEESKLLASSQKPDGETVGRPDVASEICAAKILPAPKSRPPFSKAPSLLQKFKPSTSLPRRGAVRPSTSLPRRGDVSTSLPRRGAVSPSTSLPRRSAVPPSGLHLPKPSLATRTLQESSAVSSSYKLRSTTTGLRPAAAQQQPKAGAEKPQIAGGPSGIPKGPPLLRPPSTRSSPLASSADRKPPNSAVPVPQTRKRDLSRDAQLVVKKAKMDVPAVSGAVAAPRPSVDASSAVKSLRSTSKTAKDDAAVSSAARNAASRNKILKPPVKRQKTPLVKCSGCAKCVVLEAEIQRLKEELQRHKEGKDV